MDRLESASLEPAPCGDTKGHLLFNCDEHHSIETAGAAMIAAMKPSYLALGLLVLAGTQAFADDPPMSAAESTAQAQARQFGMFLGGTATQYDLCVRKGFLAKGDQSAEDLARAYIEKMRATTKGPDEFAFVQDGWETIRREVSQHEAFFTPDKCAGVGREWAKILLKIRSK